MSTEAFATAVFPRLDDAQTAAERARAQRRGYADGHAEGFRAGRADAAASAERDRLAAQEAAAAAQRETAAALQALRQATAAVQVRAEQAGAAAAEQVIAHAIELAEIILAAELSAAGASAAAALRRALAAAPQDDIVRLRLNPDDLAVLTADDALPDLPVEADAELQRGDAIAVLEHGFIDARIGAALDRARAAGAAS